MKIRALTHEEINQLSQLDRIEYILKNSITKKWVYSNIPFIEILIMFFLLLFSRLYVLTIFAAIGITESSIRLANSSSIFFNAVIVLLAILAIARLYNVYKKHNSLSLLYLEFLDKLTLKNLRISNEKENNIKKKRK